MSADTFAEIPVDPDVDKKIEEKHRALTVASNADTIRRMPKLQQVNLPQPPHGLSILLKRTIDSVTADAAQKVREHLAKHRMTRGERWIAEGLRLATDNCPFCEQPLAGSDLIDAFRDYFSDGYRKFESEVREMQAAFDGSLSEAMLAEVQRSVAGNATAIAFWRAYARMEAPLLSYEETIHPVLTTLRNTLAPLIARKANAPLEAIEYPPEATAAIEVWKGLRAGLDEYNKGVTAYNHNVAEVQQAAAAKTAAQIQRELDASTHNVRGINRMSRGRCGFGMWPRKPKSWWKAKRLRPRKGWTPTTSR